MLQIFSSCGTIAAVRLVRSNKGGFRGYAYLEFESKSSVEAALKLDRQVIDTCLNATVRGVPARNFLGGTKGYFQPFHL